MAALDALAGSQDPVVAQVERAAGGLANDGEGVGQKRVEGLARREAPAQDPRLVLKLL